MNPAVLTVYSSPFPKIRLGRKNDGGYVIVAIPDIKYSLLLSGGVANDLSFEESFTSMYGVKCMAFDGTIKKAPRCSSFIELVHKNIGADNAATVTNLHDIINMHEQLFVKMDIEGHEINWIKSLSDEQLNKFEQIVIEFHHPFSEKEVDVFDKINKNHVLAHFHGNNAGGVKTHAGVRMPVVFECTYLHKKHFFAKPELNRVMIPSQIDMKNVLHKDEIYINYPPFVNKENAEDWSSDGGLSHSNRRGESNYSPTMTAAEAEHLHRALSGAKCYLEYGAGQSTIWACKLPNLTEIMCVESDAAFAAGLVSENPVLKESLEGGRLCFRLPDIGPTKAWGHPADQSKAHLWPGYALCPYHHGFAPDLVLIDGRFRVACGLLAALELKPGTRLMIHDYRDRPQYHVLGEFLEKTKMVDTLVEFTPHPKCDRKRAGKLLKDYLYLPDDHIKSAQ